MLILLILKELPECTQNYLNLRVDFVKNLFLTCWKKDEFIQIFNEVLNLSWKDEVDLPFLKISYTSLFCGFVYDNTYNFRDLKIIL